MKNEYRAVNNAAGNNAPGNTAKLCSRLLLRLKPSRRWPHGRERRGSEDLWISPPEQTSEENLKLC